MLAALPVKEALSTRFADIPLQTAGMSFVRDTANYGDEYYLVVRCAGGWAEEQVVDQRFAVVVELEHQPEVRLHARLRQRVRV